MNSAEQTDEGPLIDLAREALYRYLSWVVAGPRQATWQSACDRQAQAAVTEAAFVIDEFPRKSTRSVRGTQDLPSFDIQPLIQALGRPPEALCAEFDRVFGLVVPVECPPFETEFLPASETFTRAQHMADAAGFYRAFGVEPSKSRRERPDSLTLELEFMAFLLMKRRLAANCGDRADVESIDVTEHAERDFFETHLAWWVSSFARGLESRAQTGYLHALARVLADFIALECRRFGVDDRARPKSALLVGAPEEHADCGTCPLASN